jgi:hypothetical protein
MIHYHGLPMTPDHVAAHAMQGKHAFVSFAHPDQIEIAKDVCQSFALDNGAFSAWMAGNPISDWYSFYEWAAEHLRHPSCDWAVIPDVIDGDEAANDELLNQWPLPKWAGVPVWHMHESIDRLERLCREWPRVALGSSGQYAKIGTDSWWDRIRQAMQAVCINGQPICKLHGLRMLDPNIFSMLPLSSADSTNVARNIGIDSRWTGSYQPPDKRWRAEVIIARIEAANGAHQFTPEPQQTLF